MDIVIDTVPDVMFKKLKNTQGQHSGAEGNVAASWLQGPWFNQFELRLLSIELHMFSCPFMDFFRVLPKLVGKLDLLLFRRQKLWKII